MKPMYVYLYECVLHFVAFGPHQQDFAPVSVGQHLSRRESLNPKP